MRAAFNCNEFLINAQRSPHARAGTFAGSAAAPTAPPGAAERVGVRGRGRGAEERGGVAATGGAAGSTVRPDGTPTLPPPAPGRGRWQARPADNLG